ncbi:MAG: FtsX-like permease family protein [Chloroflexia bacterium]|nr:FtsX-like permease family protein [Bacteroidales bacterium]NJO92789.1 FtsX-like permease family protein [Chloroflexia bacterium]
MNDIAILKANGFKGKDIIKIFVTEAFIMGAIGTLLGLSLGAVFIQILSGVYIGPPVGYFPIKFDASIFISATLFGLIASVGAGYLPARKAAKIDPVEIFRK